MLLSIVIPCHGGAADTRACIESLAAQAGAPPLEVVLVDNASPDETARLGDAFGDLVRTVRLTENRGFAGGVNAGLRVARGERILLLNNDTLAAEALVARLLEALHCDEQIGLVSAVSNHVKGAARIDVGSCGAEAAGRQAIEDELTTYHRGQLEDIETLSGLCLLARRSLFDEIGGLDERFTVGNFEDDDFCLRARLAGHRLVIARDAFVHHHGHRTFHALGIDYREVMREHEARFRAKWRGDCAGAAWIARLCGNEVSAGDLAELALIDHPHWLDAHWLIARGCAARGEPIRALAHLATYLEQCPHHTDAALLAAFQTLESGDAIAGHERLRATLQRQPIQPTRAADVLARLATWCSEHGHTDAAIAHLRDAVALSPDDGELHNRLGAAGMDAGDWQLAQVHLTRADDLGSAFGATNLGICAWRQGDHPRALAILEDAVRRHPDNEVARHNLDLARASLGDPLARCPGG